MGREEITGVRKAAAGEVDEDDCLRPSMLETMGELNGSEKLRMRPNVVRGGGGGGDDE